MLALSSLHDDLLDFHVSTIPLIGIVDLHQHNLNIFNIDINHVFTMSSCFVNDISSVQNIAALQGRGRRLRTLCPQYFLLNQK